MKKVGSVFIICLGLILLLNLTTFASISSNERDALIALYNSTSGANWTENSGWLGAAGTECDWYGVYCDGDGDYVHEIDLYSNNLTGTIPADIGNLTNLDYLDLGANQLAGAIPTQIKNLANLTILWLEDNELTGTIPVEIGNLTNLEALALYSNNFTGIIPAEISNLTNLFILDLGGNNLTGSIPEGIGSLAYLTDLWLDSNQLTGPIPSQIGNLINLEYLWLESNQLTGPIPSQIGNLINLEYLQLDSNQITGTIPAELMNLVSLYDDFGLDLCGNNLYTSSAILRDFLNQYQVGGDWESCQDAFNDTDGDGFTDAEEVLCGSDPADSASKCIGLSWLMLLLGD